MAQDWILALNAGSSSLKLAVFERSGAARIGGAIIGDIDVGVMQKAELERHLGALSAAHGLKGPPAAIGHRIVHGLDLLAPSELTPSVLKTIERASVFAPLHNPPALRVLELARECFAAARQIACFDTAFHGGNPRLASEYALPLDIREQGIRRYGFHGLSYASAVRHFAKVTGEKLPHRLLVCHLGAGASMAAIVDGRGIASSMGFSPMEGLVMATRAGSMDAGVIFHLLRTGRAPDDIEAMLNKRSGLLALSGTASMKEMLERSDAEAEFAVTYFCYWACRHAGSLIAAMQGVDGVVFTGGIGEHAEPVREKIIQGLAWAGVSAGNSWVLAADEEGEIARSVLDILER